MGELGPYTTLRKGRGGAPRVLFEVPKRLRSAEWPATIPLPLSGPVQGLTEGVRAEILADATALYERLLGRREKVAAPADRTWRNLVRLYQETPVWWREKKPSSQLTYQRYLKRIVDHFDSDPNLAPGVVVESQILEFLKRWDSHPEAYTLFMTMFRALLPKAVREGWRAAGLDIAIKNPKRKEAEIVVWEQEDIDRILRDCAEFNQPALAGFLLTCWETGQRHTDVRLFRHGIEYFGDRFEFQQSKTGAPACVFVSPEFAALLGEGEHGEYLFLNPRTSQPFTAAELANRLYKLRKRVKSKGGRDLQLRQIRHSVVAQLARAECTIMQIRSVTGHKINTVHGILEKYFGRDDICAQLAFERRAAMRQGTTPVEVMLEGERRTYLLSDRPGAGMQRRIASYAEP